jgi:hypothetical protein
MFSPGDRVELVKSSSGYDPGAQGLVITLAGPDVLQVDIDKAENGDPIQPPDPLPPLPSDYFNKV